MVFLLGNSAEKFSGRETLNFVFNHVDDIIRNPGII